MKKHVAFAPQRFPNLPAVKVDAFPALSLPVRSGIQATALAQIFTPEFFQKMANSCHVLFSREIFFVTWGTVSTSSAFKFEFNLNITNMKSKIAPCILASLLLAQAGSVSAATVLNLATGITTSTLNDTNPNQTFNSTFTGVGFEGGTNVITSGVTTLETAIAFTLAGNYADGRFNNGQNGFTNGANTTVPSITYNLSSVNLGSLVFWNYWESTANNRGLTQADITVTHSGGTTTIQDLAFAQNSGTSTNSTAQVIDLGQNFTGVTAVKFDDLRSTQAVFVGWDKVAFAVPEPSSAALLGFAGLGLAIRRRRHVV